MQILNVCIAFIMFGVALSIQPSHFFLLKHHRKALITGLVSQYLLLPFLTWLLVLILQPSPGIALGMLLVAACPGGNVSNFFSMLAKGHVALSVALTAITSLACFVVTPAVFFLWASLTPGLAGELKSFEIDFSDLLLNMIGMLLLPLVAGMGVNHLWPNFAEKLGKPVRTLSIMMLGGFIVAALMGNGAVFKEHIMTVFWVVLLHNALGLLGGYFFSKLLRNREDVNRAVAIETGIQNSGLALALIFSFFDGNGYMALIAAWWGVWHLVSGFSFAMFFKGRPTTGNP